MDAQVRKPCAFDDAPKHDPELKKRMAEQLAMEQKALDQQRAERELRELLARKEAEAARAAASARQKALNDLASGLKRAVEA